MDGATVVRVRGTRVAACPHTPSEDSMDLRDLLEELDGGPESALEIVLFDRAETLHGERVTDATAVGDESRRPALLGAEHAPAIRAAELGEDTGDRSYAASLRVAPA
jgi:hypothetical protein